MITNTKNAIIPKILILFILCAFLAIIIQPAYAGDNFFSKPRPLMGLAEGWQYCWGGSPFDELEIPFRIFDDAPESRDWKRFQVPGQPPNSRNATSVWVRVRLPEDEWEEPGILFITNDQWFRVFLAGQLIYQYGYLQEEKQKTPGSPWHFIPLPANYQNKYLYFQMDSVFQRTTGLIRLAELGSHGEAQIKIIRDSIDYLIFGSLFVLLGFGLIIIFVMESSSQKLFFALGFSSLCAGVWLISETNMRQLLFDIPPIYWTYSAIGSLYLLPIGVCVFVEQIFGGKYRLIIRRLWQTCFLFTIITFALDFINLIPLVHTLNVFYILLMVATVLLIAIISYEARKGNHEAKILGWGIIVFAITGIYDLLGWYFRIVPWQRYTVHWGLFVFITLLIFLLRKHYLGIHQKVCEYSNEIQLKNETLHKMWLEIKESRDKIAEWNKTLEQRVAERTEQLAEVNNELMLMLETLQRTQARLIQSEKMSSLGNLVAGVTHELITPIGISVTAASHLAERTTEIAEANRKNQVQTFELEKYFELSRDMSKIILTNLDRATNLIRSFKQVAVDQSSEEKRCFNVQAYIKEVLVSLQPKLKKTAHQIKIDCADDLEINSYPGALSQIITNMVMNSLIHAFDEEDSGMIIFTVNKSQAMLSFKYSDNGKGISKENLGRIFNPFFTTMQDKGGTGLGLHIIYNIVTQTLHGTIKCQSKPGQGTTFSISFPA